MEWNVAIVHNHLMCKRGIVFRHLLSETGADIGGQHKIILVFDQLYKVFGDRFVRLNRAVEPDVATPVSTFFLQSGEWGENRWVHVGEMYVLMKSAKFVSNRFPE